MSEVLAPLSLYVSVYLATFVAAGLFLMPHVQWAALLSAATATAITIRVWERGSWNVGLVAPPRTVLRETMFGIAFAAILIGACNVIILATTELRQGPGGGFPIGDLAGVFIPAALHEELAFRGYVYQKLRQWSRVAAIGISSVVFALLHAGNVGVSALAIANILIAGVLLALAYERYRRLWFPIGIHFAWNVLSGPILGFPVSGFIPRESMLRVTGNGAVLLTGGAFGIEASVWMSVAEVIAILLLIRISNFEFRKFRMKN